MAENSLLWFFGGILSGGIILYNIGKKSGVRVGVETEKIKNRKILQAEWDYQDYLKNQVKRLRKKRKSK